MRRGHNAFDVSFLSSEQMHEFYAPFTASNPINLKGPNNNSSLDAGEAQ